MKRVYVTAPFGTVELEPLMVTGPMYEYGVRIGLSTKAIFSTANPRELMIRLFTLGVDELLCGAALAIEPTALSGEDLRAALDLAVEVKQGRCDRPPADLARQFATVMLAWFGGGSLVARNHTLESLVARNHTLESLVARNHTLEAWARDADDRVGEAHSALEDAGIGAGPIGKLLTIAERVRILAKQRDEARAAGVK